MIKTEWYDCWQNVKWTFHTKKYYIPQHLALSRSLYAWNTQVFDQTRIVLFWLMSRSLHSVLIIISSRIRGLKTALVAIYLEGKASFGSNFSASELMHRSDRTLLSEASKEVQSPWKVATSLNCDCRSMSMTYVESISGDRNFPSHGISRSTLLACQFDWYEDTSRRNILEWIVLIFL